jgi:hypothetical protein
MTELFGALSPGVVRARGLGTLSRAPPPRRVVATGWLGFFNALLLAPVVVVLHVTGVERLDSVPMEVIGWIVRWRCARWNPLNCLCRVACEKFFTGPCAVDVGVGRQCVGRPAVGPRDCSDNADNSDSWYVQGGARAYV